MDLVQASVHLKYEFDMLIVTATLLSKPNLDAYARNAILESWVQHVRNLIDFFYTPKKQDNIVMADFLIDIEIPESFPRLNADLKKAKKRANKEMSHLTYTRVGIKLEEKEWPVGIITNYLEETMSSFISLVPAERVTPGLREKNIEKSESTYLIDTISDTVGNG